uniref:NADH-ubiquinone oxidoreductase chain 2 n=1 Tax=Hyaloraphidium curvatum TaxID=82268 RepID=NU2M_HYACU|nr:NADH dehydrogenase subunit 2 [Hyaloraphidium curvatum]Q950U6.1 RecName: Full=NADH-ubiquinone oxidoreductase chain 2; AltName: Full=NADH dehydrogenase subunit 2 [Hyaloraphidium curvatum]AAK83420.1 NADH dehydrogenase subunit 2 [Hyaloraphidium curvatum]
MLYLLLTTTLLMMTWNRYAGRIAFLSLLGYFVIMLNIWLHFGSLSESVTLLFGGGLVRLDESILSALLFILFLGLVIMNRTGDLGWEFHLLLMGGLTGAIYMLTAYDLLLMVVGFEFLNLSTYLILSLYRGTETATLKYLLSSAFYTTLLLLAISFFYGLTGSTGYDALFVQMNYLGGETFLPQILLLGTIAFKLGLVPAHLWVPDVYDGLPMTLLSWMGSVPKAAVLLWLPTIYPLLNQLAPFLLVLSALSFLLSAVLMAAQYKMKRFLAYSAIGHLGFVVAAFAIGDYHAYGYYIFIYMIATLAQFVLLSELPQTELMKQTSVLKDHRALGLGFLVIVLTMASLPPFAGFYAKLLVLFGFLEIGYGIFAVLLILASLRSAAYYLKWIQTTFFSVVPFASAPIQVQYPNLVSFLVTLILPSTLLLLL